jgi:N-hydroxyarylamine O-acetyltransferase
MDLDAYFERIGWGDATNVRLDTLAGIIGAHTAAFPFENLDVLLGRRIRLDLDGLTAKLIQARRGGYCFEQVTLLAAVLDQLGFAPVRHTARVTLTTAREASPRTHMVLTVALPEGAFIVDPAFGALSPRRPVPLAAGAEVSYGNETHWLSRDGRHWLMHARSYDKLTACWATTLDADNVIDFELGNHYTSTHPDSSFVNRLMLCAHSSPERERVTVVNRVVWIHRATGVETRELADRRALRELLAERFGFDLPEVEHMRVPSIPEWS